MKTIFLKKLPSIIQSIGKSGFFDIFIHFLEGIEEIESALLIYFHHSSPPEIYRSPNDRSSYDKIYIDHAYLIDPAFKSTIDNQEEIYITTLDIEKDTEGGEYFREFYRHVPWKNETNIMINLGNQEYFCIVMGSNIEIKSPIHLSKNIDKEILPIIRSILIKHFIVSKIIKVEHSNLTYYEYGLTKKQSQVVQFILQGLSTKDISLELSISEGTVKNHRKSIYKRLGIHSQAELFKIFS